MRPPTQEGLQLETVLDVLRDVRQGNYAARIPLHGTGSTRKLVSELNTLIQATQRSQQDLSRSAENAARVARVLEAVAAGDLSQTMELEADARPLQEPFLRTARTVNSMVRQLRTFTSEVTRVAEEVGTQGKLGGQAIVPGAAGTWDALTNNVNRLAANLTIQVRAIADVATAVTEGDLTRSIGVEAQGEVALLKDKINEMIRRLRETTEKNTQQDWLKTNLAKHTRMLQGQRDLTTAAQLILSEVAPLVDAQHGSLYTAETSQAGTGHLGQRILRLRASYAMAPDDLPAEFRIGEGLIGQCALGQRPILMSDLPPGMLRIRTGLGEVTPADLVLIPILFEGEVKAVIELASVRRFSRIHLDFLDQLTEGIGIVLNAIEANMRTEELLKQSQILFAEAQEASRSKSAFLSMAAHELRTPLSVISGYLSMLQDGTLTLDTARRPIEMLIAKANELNQIVSDLLMAARVEGGTVPTQLVKLDLRSAVADALKRAEPRTTLLDAAVSFTATPEAVPVHADPEQLARILDNLINNALTYTKGRPDITIWVSQEGAARVFIEDRGLGIPADARDRIFERFYRIDQPELGPQPGTGLGLFISRELAQRLGGSLNLDWSEVGRGTRFVLTLPSASAIVEAVPSPAPVAIPVAARRAR